MPKPLPVGVLEAKKEAEDPLKGMQQAKGYADCVIDDYNREALAIDIDLSLPSERVIRALDQIIEWRGKPLAIRSDNGPAYISGIFIAWAKHQGIRLNHIQPGNPQQNAYIERYNRTVR